MQSINRAERRRSSRESAKRARWEALEEFTRRRIQDWMQDLLEEEVAEHLGRRKSERRAAVDAPHGEATAGSSREYRETGDCLGGAE